MATIKHCISEWLWLALQHAFPQHNLDKSQLEVAVSTGQFGHYQCNSAMRFAKAWCLKPREVASAWVDALSPQPLIEKVAIAGPGFINLWLNPKAIAARLNEQDFGLSLQPYQGQRIVIDFSSPNIAKQMHVGHLRSTIIGDCLARIFEYLQVNVLRLNHLGDWGTAFGMLIAYLKAEQPKVLSSQQTTDLSHLVQWYRAAKALFDSDVVFKKTAQQQVVALQSGDPAALQAWQLICEISRQDYQAIYDLLDVRLTERGESFYNPMLAETVQALTDQGLVTLSDGAKCVFLTDFYNREGQALPLIIQKSDGGYNYATTDLAAICHRVQQEHAERILYLTDAGQAQHFAMVFETAKQVGFLTQNSKTVRLDHVPFGLVLGPDGKKFKTRSGDTEPLIDLLQAAISEAKRLLQQRDCEMPLAELEHTAKVLGINAIKYADLSTNRLQDYVFSYEKMLRFEGNTAAFLMYAYVRIQSIKRRVGIDTEQTVQIALTHAAEIDLAIHLLRFGEVVLQIAEDLLPHRLCDYLFTLAEKFHAFFRDCRVVGSEQQASRLKLCDLTAQVLAQGMQLLGLQCVTKM